VPAALAVGTQRQERAAIDHVIGIRGVAPFFVDGPTNRNRLAAAARDFNFPVRGGAGGHVDDDRRLILAGKRDGDRIGAQHPFRAPQRSDQLGGIGHGPADEVTFECFQNIVAGNSVVIGVLHAYPAGAEALGHVHGKAIGVGTDNEAKPIVAIDGGCAGRGAHHFDFRQWIDAAELQHLEVSVQPGHAVGVDSAQVRGRENVGGLGSVHFGHPEMNEYARTEFAQGFRGKDFGLDFGHVVQCPFGKIYAGRICPRVSVPNGTKSNPITKAIEVSATGIPSD